MSATLSSRGVGALADFVDTSLDAALAGADDDAGAQAGALALFHSVARDVLAYAAFLAEHGIDSGSIRTFSDFERLPLLTKLNYHARYPLAEMCRGGKLEATDLIAVSSGSTGQPTAACCRWLAARGYPLTVITPGNNISEILRVVERLGPDFEQIVLLGYPPFLKDAIDTGLARAHHRPAQQLAATGGGGPQAPPIRTSRRGLHHFVLRRQRVSRKRDCWPRTAAIDQWVTGKFVMQAREDDDRNRYLSIVVELGPGILAGQDKVDAIAESILRNLLRLNSEFAHYVPADRQRPHIELAAQGDPDYFPVGVKHRYTRR